MILKIFRKSDNKYYDVLIDDEDYPKVKNHKWCIGYSKIKNRYIIQATIFIPKKTTIYFHRLIMDAQKGEQVDHIFHNTLDCRKSKMRKCNNQENQYNQKLSKRNTSGYKGVCWYNNYKKWQSKIRKDKKTIHLGYFDNSKEAAIAYNKKALELFGEFACLNKVG